MAHEPLGTLVRWSLYFRLVLVALASLALVLVDEPQPLLPGALLVAAAANLFPLLWWSRFGPWAARHPLVLLPDLSLTVGLLVLTGTDGPFLFYSLASVFLGGLVYGTAGGVAASGLVVGGYLIAVDLGGGGTTLSGFQALVATPTFLVLVAVAGAAIRRLLAERAAAEARAHQRTADAAISEDRARLARELHDSVAKTLQGISLQAAALERLVRTDLDRAAQEARSIGRTCHVAAQESRDLLTALRTQRLDLPLPEAVAELAETWSRRTGCPVEVTTEPTPPCAPEVRHELLRIVDEALCNVERHADATAVSLTVGVDAGRVVVRIADDGRGLPAAPDPRRLAAEGHYGLQGIVERAHRLGGAASFTAAPGRGLQVDVTAPLTIDDGDPLRATVT